MASKGCENILKSLLNSVFDFKIKTVEIIENKELKLEYKGGKKCIVDSKAIINGNTKLITEMQIRKTPFFEDKSLNYLATEFSYSIKSGDTENIPKHFLFIIANFGLCKKFTDNTKIIKTFNISETQTSNCIFSGKMMIYCLDLVQFRRLKKIDLKNNLHQWCIFFNKNNYPKEFKEVLKMNPQIKEADEKIKPLFNPDKEARYIRQKLLQKEEEIYIKEREQKGIEKGRQEQNIQIASRLKKKGMDLKEIAEITDLPTKIIKTL